MKNKRFETTRRTQLLVLLGVVVVLCIWIFFFASTRPRPQSETIKNDLRLIDAAPAHYGIEVCGIAEESAAYRIAKLRCALFPEWRYGHISYQDRDRDRGWKVEIFKRSRDDVDSQTA